MSTDIASSINISFHTKFVGNNASVSQSPTLGRRDKVKHYIR